MVSAADESWDGSDPSLPEMSEQELVARLALLASTDREKYRRIRDAAWKVVAARSAHSEFPSESS